MKIHQPRFCGTSVCFQRAVTSTIVLTLSCLTISCPADINVQTKENEKLHKYKPLLSDFHCMYNMPVQIIPMVIGHTGVMTAHCQEFQDDSNQQ